jgi:hypothetical protein
MQHQRILSSLISKSHKLNPNICFLSLLFMVQLKNY